jgi:hypothetical protein
MNTDGHGQLYYVQPVTKFLLQLTIKTVDDTSAKMKGE